MKNFYIITLCALMGASSAIAGTRFQSAKNMPRKQLKRVETKVPLWRPGTVVESMCEDGEWIDPITTKYTYDRRGNALVIESSDGMETAREVREYNEWDQIVSSITTVEQEDGTWVNERRRSFVYDPVVHNFFTERRGYTWNGDDWTADYSWEDNIITRNPDGCITEIVKYVPLYGELSPSYRSVWEYGADGKATSFAYYYNYSVDPMNVTWELDVNTSYRNITWAATDGQMVLSSFYEMVEGANRVASAEVYYNDELDGHIFVTYTDRDGEYAIKDTYADPAVVGRTSVKTFIDDNGSYRITDSEYFDEDGEPTAEPTYSLIFETFVDDHGNIIGENYYEAMDGGEPELFDSRKAEYTYDANGNPTEMISYVYDYDAEDFVPETRIEYSDYADVAGVGSIVAGVAEPIAVYNLQGICVGRVASASELGNLPAGIYIANGRKFIVR